MAKSKKKLDWLKALLAVSILINGWFFVDKFGPASGDTRQVTVNNIVDGDTFDAEGERFKLMGIDAPEYPDDCLGARAKDRLSELILGKTVKLKTSGLDNFSRTLTEVSVEGLFINKALVDEGMAVLAEGGKDITDLSLTEQQAQEAERGVWSAQCTNKREGCEIKGNFHKGTKDRVYHLPSCYNYDRVVINPNEGDKWFCSGAEAEAEGFVKSKDCPQP
jgi:endonuclease YncB( thermonuclease family)